MIRLPTITWPFLKKKTAELSSMNGELSSPVAASAVPTSPSSPPLPSTPSLPLPHRQAGPLSPPPFGKTLFPRGLTSVADIIAPSALEIDFDNIRIGNLFYRTLFVAGYPRFVNANWLSPLISFDHSLEISMFSYPVEGHSVLDELKRKVGEMEATISSDLQRGRVIDPAVQVALDDALSLQSQLVKGEERFFQFGLYITIPAETLEELNTVTSQVEATLGSLMVIAKHAALQMEDGFKTTLPIGLDKLMVLRNMDTTSLATTFPFTSSELTANEGVLYGINEHNESLIIFDRFTMENANSVIFAKSGAGKSYLVKLEVLRSLMFGTEIIVIDPEEEYKSLCETVGGEYISFSFNSSSKINPFDLAGIYEEGENELGLKILSLHSLCRLMMGSLTSNEEAILDRALILTYRMKGITPDPQTQTKEPPLMEDLYKILIGMEEEAARGLAERLEKFIKGSMAGIFDRRSNIDIKNTLTIFSIKDLADELRPIAMFIILDFIWTRIKREMKKRLLVIDEAWYMMKYPESALFVYSIAKRARKYYLGLTTITQDIEDFLESDYGKAIVTNSSVQMLLKQSPAAIDKVAEVFYLSEGEKHLLLSAEVGEGLFFAGANHVAMRVIASPEEHRLITSDPKDLLRMRREKEELIQPLPVSQAPNLPNIRELPKPPPVEEKPPYTPLSVWAPRKKPWHRRGPVPAWRPLETTLTPAQTQPPSPAPLSPSVSLIGKKKTLPLSAGVLGGASSLPHAEVSLRQDGK